MKFIKKIMVVILIQVFVLLTFTHTPILLGKTIEDDVSVRVNEISTLAPEMEFDEQSIKNTFIRASNKELKDDDLADVIDLSSKQSVDSFLEGDILVFKSKKELVKKLPDAIVYNLKQLGLANNDQRIAGELIYLIREVYEKEMYGLVGDIEQKVSLLIEQYHSGVHNDITAYAQTNMVHEKFNDSLLSDDIKTSLIAALFHDFHVRLIQLNGVGTPALVAETLRQFTDLLGIKLRGRLKELVDKLGITEVYQGPAEGAESDARYNKLDSELKMKLRAKLLEFLGGQDKTEELYARIITQILRTDFAQPPPPEASSLKTMAQKVRKDMDLIISEAIKVSGRLNDKDLEKILGEEGVLAAGYAEIEQAIRENNFEENAGVMNWFERQKNIELMYITALSYVPSDKRGLDQELAVSLENADKSGYYVTCSPKMNIEIVKGLIVELPFLKKAEFSDLTETEQETVGTIIFFMVEFGPVLKEVLSNHRYDHRNNFIKVVDAFHKISLGTLDRLPEGPFKNFLNFSLKQWGDMRDDAMASLGLAETWPIAAHPAAGDKRAIEPIRRRVGEIEQYGQTKDLLEQGI